jgi:murein L,D-transpeptidase YafK
MKKSTFIIIRVLFVIVGSLKLLLSNNSIPAFKTDLTHHSITSNNPTFLTKQQKFARVRVAIKEKQETLTAQLKAKKINLSDLAITLVAYKDDDLLEVYGRPKNQKKLILIKSYPICARSGILGPKRKEGDGQVPEGFYYINVFNPSSNYYLSLGINYPNSADRLKSSYKSLGGNIFIHGSCVTIGCLPMTDDLIKEIYVLAVHAKNNGQSKIPVYIFPYKMENSKHKEHTKSASPQLTQFWNNLKQGYDLFHSKQQELNYSVNSSGDYQF